MDGAGGACCITNTLLYNGLKDDYTNKNAPPIAVVCRVVCDVWHMVGVVMGLLVVLSLVARHMCGCGGDTLAIAMRCVY